MNTIDLKKIGREELICHACDYAIKLMGDRVKRMTWFEASSKKSKHVILPFEKKAA